jgi:formylglycine-generating enzyme required for sulfatase activity
MTNRQYLRIAKIVAKSSKCERNKVGAVLVKDNKIISTGYNGTATGTDNCCEENNKTLPTVIHAELNAILNATTNDLEGSSMYITLAPCLSCASLIIQKGISSIYYIEEYHTNGIKYLQDNGVLITKVDSGERKPFIKRNNMVWVEGGSFIMGSNEGQDWEKPVYRVTLDGFYMGKYSVTFEEYDRYCEATGAKKPDDEGWGRGKRPVINVSWNDAQAYCTWLSKKAGRIYRLPTEVEWENAARGRLHKEGYKYSGSDNIDEVAWYDGNSGNKTHPVGQKKPNALDIYDMSGNVFEWCEDDWHVSYQGAPSDGSAWVDRPRGSGRVFRGGGWGWSVICRVAYRYFSRPADRSDALGFRVVCN